ncbi:MAG TPA: hypothetical protein VMU22_06495 [Rhizomicrobium sp.]|nr:hypothetical protein [Rhizomicrobium sp.]
MPALAIRRVPEFEPEEIVSVEVAEQPRGLANGIVIGAHADYCRDDFIFPRMQSRAMQDTPWGHRIKRMRSWSEIAGIGLLFGVASCALVLSTAFI